MPSVMTACDENSIGAGEGWTTGELAGLLDATLVGPDSLRVNRLDSLQNADESTLTFIRDEPHAAAWASSLARVAIVSKHIELTGHDPVDRALLIVDDADHALITLLEAIAPEHVGPLPGTHPTASIDESAQLGKHVRIGPGVVVGARSRIGDGAVLNSNVVIGAKVTIGAECDLRAGVVVEDRCCLGERVMIHPNAVIGSDGFGYRPAADGTGLVKIPHAGAVEIHDDVEIGAGAMIDRGKFGATVIGAGAKIDNLVQIGHNCIIGRACLICGSCGIAGSVTIGDGAVLGGGVGVKDNITIGAGARIGARSGVMEDIPPGESWVGAPARPAREMMRIFAATSRLPKLLKALRARGITLEDQG